MRYFQKPQQPKSVQKFELVNFLIAVLTFAYGLWFEALSKNFGKDFSSLLVFIFMFLFGLGIFIISFLFVSRKKINLAYYIFLAFSIFGVLIGGYELAENLTFSPKFYLQLINLGMTAYVIFLMLNNDFKEFIFNQ